MSTTAIPAIPGPPIQPSDADRQVEFRALMAHDGARASDIQWSLRRTAFIDGLLADDGWRRYLAALRASVAPRWATFLRSAALSRRR